MISAGLASQALAVALLGCARGDCQRSRAAEEPGAYTVEVSDATGKVGETTTLLATLRPKEGYKILHVTTTV